MSTQRNESGSPSVGSMVNSREPDGHTPRDLEDADLIVRDFEFDVELRSPSASSRTSAVTTSLWMG